MTETIGNKPYVAVRLNSSIVLLKYENYLRAFISLKKKLYVGF